MNAYELADELQELDSKLHLINLFKSANMLRQQADRIAELEKSHIELEKGIVADLNKRQSAKPVAWMDYKGYLLDSEDVENYPKEGLVCIPLYTTPQIKELSDEEIKSIWNEGIVGWYASQEESVLKFAREILKKASDK